MLCLRQAPGVTESKTYNQRRTRNESNRKVEKEIEIQSKDQSF